METEVLNKLREIEKLPALDDELWCNLVNLCETINDVCYKVSDMVDLLNSKDTNENVIESINQSLYNIGTLADVIQEKIPFNDLCTISNIISALIEKGDAL